MFKLKFGLLELNLVLVKGLLYVTLHAFEFTTHHVLVLAGSLSEFRGKLTVVVHDSLFQFLHLNACLLGKLVILSNQ